MLVQYYKVAGDISKAAPGQAVMMSNETDEIAGFIVDVFTESSELSICLFNPTKLGKFEHTVLAKELTNKEVFALLDKSKEANPATKQMWDSWFGFNFMPPTSSLH